MTGVLAGGISVVSIATMPGVASACMKTLPFSSTTQFDHPLVATQASRDLSPTYFTFAYSQAHLLMAPPVGLRSAVTHPTPKGDQSYLDAPVRSLLFN